MFFEFFVFFLFFIRTLKNKNVQLYEIKREYEQQLMDCEFSMCLTNGNNIRFTIVRIFQFFLTFQVGKLEKVLV